MENPADITFWAFATTAVLGITTALVGWLKRGRTPPPEQPPASIHGAAIIDSSLARDVLAQFTEQVIVTRRLADAAEALLEIERARDKRAAADRHDSELETLRREIADLREGKR